MDAAANTSLNPATDRMRAALMRTVLDYYPKILGPSKLAIISFCRETLKKFTSCPQLAKELRDQIWDYSMKEARIIEVRYSPVGVPTLPLPPSFTPVKNLALVL